MERKGLVNPFFSYYGAKSKLAELYPPPKYGKIIEPFAGAANYSLRWFDRDITIVDKYELLIDIWKYLQQASEKDILSLPLIPRNENIDNYTSLSEPEKNLIKFNSNHGCATPSNHSGLFQNWTEKKKKQIAGNLFKIRHWKILLDSYENLENIECTWFVDPPYKYGGEYYKYSSKEIRYYKLAEWCKERLGQIIVCENSKATWLPFVPLKPIHGQKHKTVEVIWSNHKTNFDIEQLTLF